jgi:hypothetical protein
MDFLLQNPQITGSVIVIFVLVIIIKSLFYRPKLPQNKSFQCARCKVSATHSERTIEAWRKGIKKLYCPTCHKQWLQSQPRDQDHSSSQRKSAGGGCLSVIVIGVLLPSVVIGVANWLT